MKKVLIITYSYPPKTGPESTLMANFVRYLPNYKWIPVILTSKDFFQLQKKSSEKVKNRVVKIYYSVCLEDMFIKIITSHPFKVILHSETGKDGNLNQKNVIQKLNYYKIFPYWKLLLTPFIVISAIEAILTEKIDVIYSRSGPMNCHLAALLCNRIFKIPWIISFSDPWINDPNRLNQGKILPASISEYYEKKMEYIFIKNADKIIVTTKSQKVDYESRFPFTIKKIEIIPNSFDANECYDNNSFSNTHSPLIITYAGTLSDNRSPEPLFVALSQLKKEMILADRIQIRFIGGLGKYHNLIEIYNLGDIIEEIDFVTHEKIIGYYSESDVLLLIDSEKHFMCLPTKLVEYIFMGKPILAITSDIGESANLIRETNSGIIVSPKNILKIQKTIEKIVYSNRFYNKNPNWEKIDQYSAKKCTKKLSNILKCIHKTKDKNYE